MLTSQGSVCTVQFQRQEMSDILFSRQEKEETLVFNFDPENVPYLSLLRDLQSKDGGSQNDTHVPSSQCLSVQRRQASCAVANANVCGLTFFEQIIIY